MVRDVSRNRNKQKNAGDQDVRYLDTEDQNDPTDKGSADDGISFEDSLEELEALVDRLERGQLLLDESLELFEKGMKLARLCNRKLSKAERKIQTLIEENGSLKTVPFTDD